jgi:glycosyltransferase involved in cell wall biosynthesis
MTSAPLLSSHLRALHIHSGNLYGGVETSLIALAKLAHVRPDMTSEFALCFHGRLSDELTAHGATVHPLGAVRARYPWTVSRSRRALEALLRKGDYDVAICHSAWAQAIFAPAVRRSRAKLVFYFHAATSGRNWLERWAQKVTPDCVIYNSAYTKSCLERVYAGTRAEVLYFPVEPPQRLTFSQRLAVREELHTSPDNVVIIQVSRMEALKGHLLHLEALAALPASCKWTAWVVGGAQRPVEVRYLKDVKSKAQALGIADRVRFLGERADIPALLGAADIFCQPNLSPESFGLSFVEALYAGLPVITTAMGGALEIIDDSCGILVPPDKDMLSDALLRLACDIEARKRLAAVAPNRAATLCNPAIQMKRMHGALNSICRSKVGAGCNVCPG